MNDKKVIWITGASSGIGRSLALKFAKEGWTVAASARRENLLQELHTENENIHSFPLDVTNTEQCKVVFNDIVKKFENIEICVFGTGIHDPKSEKNFNLDKIRKIMEVNYTGTVALTKAVLPYFIEKQQGQIVVTTSIVGLIGTPLRSSYAASKHALHGFFDSLRAEVHDHHIDVTLICPGFVSTNISMNALTGDGTSQQKMDTATANGISPERFAKLMAKAIHSKKEEAYIAGFKEKLGVYVKRWFPRVFSIMIRKLSVT